MAVGSPIRLGRCTPRIKRFLKDNQARLAVSQTAFFFTCMSATAGEADQDQTLYVDPRFDAPDRPRPRLRAMERNHTARYYLDHFRKLIPGIRPVFSDHANPEAVKKQGYCCISPYLFGLLMM